MKNLFTLSLLLSVFLFGNFSTAQAQSIKVIANNSVDISEVSLQDLLFIYGLKNKRFTDGSRIVLFQFNENSEMNDVFYRKLGRDFKIFKNVWTTLQFKGEGFPPSQVQNQVEMIRKVKDTPGAIGFVSSSINLGSDVKVLAELPL